MNLPKFLYAEDLDGDREFVIHNHWPRFTMEFVDGCGTPLFHDPEAEIISLEQKAGREPAARLAPHARSGRLLHGIPPPPGGLRMTIPPDFALTHITVNSGHSFRKEVFEDKRPAEIAKIASHFKSLLATNSAPMLEGLHATMINVAPHEGPCAGWYLHPTGDPRMAMVTCFASLAPNAALFASAVELARGQFSSFAEGVSERLTANPAALDDSFLAPHGVISTPEPPWLATVLHLPFFRCPREYIPMVADLNQCLAATALHQP